MPNLSHVLGGVWVCFFFFAATVNGRKKFTEKKISEMHIHLTPGAGT